MVLGCSLEEGALLLCILVVAGQAREVVKHWRSWACSSSLWWNKDREGHITLIGLTPVSDSLDISSLNLIVLCLIENQLGTFKLEVRYLDNGSQAVSTMESVN